MKSLGFVISDKIFENCSLKLIFWTQDIITTNKNYLNSFAIESMKDNPRVIFITLGQEISEK